MMSRPHSSTQPPHHHKQQPNNLSNEPTMTAPDSENYQIFRDCVSSAIVAKFSPTPRTKKARRPRTTPRQKSSSRADPKPDAEQVQQNEFTRTDPEDLADFIDVRSLHLVQSNHHNNKTQLTSPREDERERERARERGTQPPPLPLSPSPHHQKNSS